MAFSVFSEISVAVILCSSVLSVLSVVDLIGVWRTSSVHPALWGAQIGVLFANSDCRRTGTKSLHCSKVICQSPFIGIE